MRGSGRSGEYEVSADTFVDRSSSTPKFRTIISIQPDDDHPPRRSHDVPTPSSNDFVVTNGPADHLSAADPDETASVSSTASSNSRTPWTTDQRQNGHVRSASSASSTASAASYHLRTPGSYVSPTSPRRETTNVVDEQPWQLVEHPFFALFRDAPYEESQILSGRGTVRGVRNRVKSGVAVFVEKDDTSLQKVCLHSAMFAL